MMRGGKEEEKTMPPMFPRLHVNDADKGGPRAPPRNKMALYEQLSIPSHRFSSAGSSALSRPNSASAVVPSASLSQGGSQERGLSSPFHRHPHPNSHPNEKVHSHVSDEKTVNSAKTEFERSTRHANRRSSNATISVAECSSLLLHDVSDTKSSNNKRFDEEDDFRVPTFVQSEVASSANEHTVMKENQRLSSFHVNSLPKGCSPAFSSSLWSPNSYDKPLGQKVASDMKLKKHGSKDSEQESNETMIIKENTEKPAVHENGREKLAELSGLRKEYLNHENMRTGNVFGETCQQTVGVHQISSGNGVSDELGCLSEKDVAKEGVGLRWRSESCLKTSSGSSDGNSNVGNNCNRENNNKASGLQEVVDQGTNEVSEILMDSISSLNISPDDVVGVIGQKQFWKARRAIVNQQRIFALQVFELHRLIKVQKLIAASPHLLLGDDPYISTSEVPSKSPCPLSNVESQPKITKQKDDFQKQNLEAERSAENTEVQPLTHCGDDPNKRLAQPSGNGPCPGELPASPMAPDCRLPPWCFHPPANQWLIPVMSPTEGLVYKPYSGLCPPNGDFMPPFYGGCGPLRLPNFGDFMNTIYGVPASYQQQLMGVVPGAPTIPSNYFMSPYGPLAANPVISGSAVKQVSQMTQARPVGPNEQDSWIPCVPTPKSEAFLGCRRKFNAAKEAVLEGNTGSNPCEGTQDRRDAQNIFPLALPGEGPSRLSRPNDRERQTHVIKVVPHDASSASESVARIFRSIQEERRQNDS